MGEISARPYDGASGSFPVRVQEVAVTDRHAPEGAVQRASDPAQDKPDKPDKPDPTDHLSGRVLDNRYLIGSRIARGGMATVYEANDLRLDRTVAVKGMHPRLGDDHEVAGRVVAGDRSAAEVSHPHLRPRVDPGHGDRSPLPGIQP